MRNAVIRDFNWSHQRALAENGGHCLRGFSGARADDGDGLPQAVVVRGAGVAGANGTYRRSDREKCGAPVYRHIEPEAPFAIAREPHTSKKTGKTKHGWLLSEGSSPLYGSPTESLEVPSQGWRAFGADTTVPCVETHRSLSEVFFADADSSGLAGEEAAEREDWEAASNAFHAGIRALECSGDRFGEPFERRAAWLLSRRAEASLRLQKHRAALRDAVAALELAPELARARSAAVDAAKALGCRDEADASELLENVGSGQILDRGAPLHLQTVERWVEEVAAAAERRGARLEAAAEAPDTAGEKGAGRPMPAKPVKEVDKEYHRGFMHWINFLRADPLHDTLYREDWADMVGTKLSALNWKYTARKKGIELSSSSRTDAVLRLMEAYEQAGKPPGPPLPQEPRCEAEHLLQSLGHTVNKVIMERPNLDDVDPTADGAPASLRIPMAKSLKPLN